MPPALENPPPHLRTPWSPCPIGCDQSQIPLSKDEEFDELATSYSRRGAELRHACAYDQSCFPIEFVGNGFRVYTDNFETNAVVQTQISYSGNVKSFIEDFEGGAAAMRRKFIWQSCGRLAGCIPDRRRRAPFLQIGCGEMPRQSSTCRRSRLNRRHVFRESGLHLQIGGFALPRHCSA